MPDTNKHTNGFPDDAYEDWKEIAQSPLVYSGLEMDRREAFLAGYKSAQRRHENLTVFEDWWQRTGQSYDPDTSDVPWEDKRKYLAEAAFDAAMAISRNYFANETEMPDKVYFANGRTVVIKDNPDPNVRHGVYLEVEG